MTDRTDTRLREIALRVTAMAPDAPPFPVTPTVDVAGSPSPNTRRRMRPVLWAAAAAAVVLGAIGIPLLFDSGPDQPVPPATDVPPTTSSPAVQTTLVPIPLPSLGAALLPAESGGVMDLYSFSVGRDPVKLTNHAGRNDYVGYPSVSPDRARVLFEARRDGLSTIQVYVMDIGGGDPVRLSDSERRESFQPEWSPDGSRIVFVRSVSAYSRSDQEVWVMNADGSDPRMLSDGDSRGPEWSTDGSTIAFYRDGETWLVPPEGGDRVQITDFEAAPDAWSPDGSLLLVESSMDAEPGGPHDEASDLWVVSRDGSSVRRLTSAPGRDWAGRWSPDGNRILFNSNRDFDTEIYVVDVTGANLTRLTDSEGIDGAGRWSEDGAQILFLSQRDGEFAVYVMNADGSDPSALAKGDPAVTPVWFAGLDWLG